MSKAKTKKKELDKYQPLHKLPMQDAKTQCFHAVVEAVAGSRNKCKFDPKLGVFLLHKVLPLGTSFPYCFGFLPSTSGADGDPLDILLFMDEPVGIGCVVPCRIIGVITAEQSEEGKTVRNDRLIGVACESKRYQSCQLLDDIDTKVLKEIENFFIFYNEQENKRFKPLARCGAKTALQLIKSGNKKFHSKK